MLGIRGCAVTGSRVLTMVDEFEKYIGKTIIIGITRLDADGELIELIQMHGVISRATPGTIEIKLSTGDSYSLPPDYDSIQPAPPGEYRFRSTGETVVDPDLMTTWTIHAPKH